VLRLFRLRWPILLALLASASLPAKELSWRSIDVRARLDERGALHVVETQTVVFDGDWNGGERTFRVFPGQSLTLSSVTRIAPDGTRQPLTEGGLAAVDEWGWTGENVLRWRSRLPEDPPFSNTAIVYELAYTISGVLVKQGRSYLLDHDFAFPEREWPIQKLTVSLDLNPVWKPLRSLPGSWTSGVLKPGSSFLVSVPLEYTGSGSPEAAKGVATPAWRRILLGLLGATIVFAYVGWRRRETALGRFAPVEDPSKIDQAWLEKNLLTLSPEEVGALWDEKIGPPEVAAVLARLSAEKKIATAAEGKTLTMRLLVPVSDFDGYDRELIEALFFGGRKETDTDAIKKHYKSQGFDPASKIRAGLAKELEKHGELRDKSPAPSRWPAGLLLLGGVLCHGYAVLTGAEELGQAIGLAIVFGVLYAIGAGIAWTFRKRVDRLDASSPLLLAVPVLIFYFAWLGTRELSRTSLVVVAGTMLLRMAIVVSLFNLAKTRSGPRRIARRKDLAAARAYFQRELKSPVPRLTDEWFPYVLALGLTSEADRWFRAHGASSAAAAGAGSRGSGSSSSSGSPASSSPGGSWTGGGGAFGGAGASASWAVAAGALAAGVSAPSSSSSGGGGGGGGGGGSSGGGGGGGW